MVASALLSRWGMNARNHLPTVARHSLEALLVEGRMPLDAALELALSLVRALADHHASGQALGAFDASSVSIDALGHVMMKASTRPQAAAPELAAGGEADLLSDVYSLGALFYRLFAGTSHHEAARRAGGSLVPPSRFNPTIDEAVDGLVLTMLDGDPMERPYRLAQVEGQLLAICGELGLELGTRALTSWVAAHRPAAVAVVTPPRRAAPVVAPTLKARPPVRWALEADDEDAPEGDDVDAAWEGPVRFDLWAAASAGVVALGVCLIALL